MRSLSTWIASQPRPRLAVFVLATVLLAVYLAGPLSAPAPQRTFPTFEEPFIYPTHPHTGALAQDRPKRVAVIGAGASGSSAAWFLRRAGRVMEDRLGKAEGELLGEIVVIDREGHVGGRTTTVYPHGDERLQPVELGASIFVDANRHMVKAARRFSLPLVDPDFGDAGVGIWDGQQMLFSTSNSKSRVAGWWDTLSALKRYGPMAPYRSGQAVKGLLKKFDQLYNPLWLQEQGAARSVEEFAERVGLGKEMTTRRGDEWATGAAGISERWMSEIMEGSTRCNYASDMNKIHGLGAAVSMAAAGASAVEGGNWRIFESMLSESKASVHLDTQVRDIVPILSDPPKFRLITNSSAAVDDTDFDAVFLATPWHDKITHATASLDAHLAKPMARVQYVRLFVTLFSTSRPSALPSFFGLPEGTEIPSTVLTTGYTSRHSAAPYPPPSFHSISWHGETAPGSGEHVVKVFSLTEFPDHLIRAVIGEEPGWIYRKRWESYPYLVPRSEYPPVEPLKGLQYLAALEPWISTMETQTLSAREAVARTVEDWWNLGYGDCKGGADAWDWSCEE